jgi:hypothetical protein
MIPPFLIKYAESYVLICGLLISTVRQHRHHAIVIGLRDEHIDIQMALSLISFLRQNVSRMRMATLDFPVAVRRTRFAAPLCVFSFGIY